jgi:hypothetical protein
MIVVQSVFPLRFWRWALYGLLPVATLGLSYSQSTNNAPNTSSQIAGAVKTQLPGGPYEPSDPRWAERLRRRQLDHNADWETAFSFYGKVIDQNNAPVQGAKVHLVWNDLSLTGSTQADMLSSEKGLFSLLSKSGKGMSVSITKDGYYSAERNPSNQVWFEFADFSDARYHEPSSTQVVIFRMYKKGLSEPVYYFQDRYIPPAGSNQMAVSLHRNNEADFRVHFSIGDKRADGNFGWGVSIEGLNGTTFAPSTNPFEFLAPDSGYQNKFDFQMNASDPNWRSQIKKQYYVHLGDGDYARIDGEFGLSNSRVPSFTLTWVLNPSGSRNLEFDPAKQINR